METSTNDLSMTQGTRYDMALWAKVFFVLLALGFFWLAFSIIFGGTRVNFLLFSLLGIDLPPLFSFCLNGFFVLVSAVVVVGAPLMVLRSPSVAINEVGISYGQTAKPETVKSLSWDDVSSAKLIASGGIGWQFKTIQLFAKSDPQVIAIGFPLSWLQRSGELEVKIPRELEKRRVALL